MMLICLASAIVDGVISYINYRNTKEINFLFMLAVQNGNTEVLREFISKVDVDINCRIEYRTALMSASHRGYTEIVKVLLEHKADPNLQDDKGNTALMIAIVMRRTGVVKLLIENKADPSIKNKKGFTAFDFARTQEMKDLLK